MERGPAVPSHRGWSREQCRCVKVGLLKYLPTDLAENFSAEQLFTGNSDARKSFFTETYLF